MKPRKRSVYMVFKDLYENRRVIAVYASLATAMRSHPHTADMRARFPKAEWHCNEHGVWDNGCDWSDSREIERWPVEGAR